MLPSCSLSFCSGVERRGGMARPSSLITSEPARPGVWMKPESWVPVGRCSLPEPGVWTGLESWVCREEGLVGGSRVRGPYPARSWRRLESWGSGRQG